MCEDRQFCVVVWLLIWQTVVIVKVSSGEVELITTTDYHTIKSQHGKVMY